MRRAPDDTIADVTPRPFSVRTRVHEYGGGAFAVGGGVVYFVNDADQRIYAVRDGHAPTPLTPINSWRYADFALDPRRGLLFCVYERRVSPPDDSGDVREVVENGLAAIPLAGGPPRSLIADTDFCASPRLSPDGQRLGWLSWNHPNMPWDGTELRVARINAEGDLETPDTIAGARDGNESIFQPEWAPDGSLWFVSDRSGWWNLYRSRAGAVEALCPREAEFGLPQWVFAMSTYAFLHDSASRVLCAFCDRGVWRLGTLDANNGRLSQIDLPYVTVSGIRTSGDHAWFVGATPTEGPAIVDLDCTTGQANTIRRSSDTAIDPGFIARAEAVQFPSEGGEPAHAFFYRPRNRDFVAPPASLPPLIVMSHGGPTGATTPAYRPAIQFWTSRGFAVLDVNYGGSTGYGRAYRQRLDGEWGVVDVADCANGARWLAQRGLVDPRRLAITGASAGGYTTLAALTFTDVFSAGASSYGISDLASLARDTHKFESHYCDRLVGPYPEQRDLYAERSPVHHVDRLSSPMIILQGLDDPVVPPNQAEAMVAALRRKGLPVAYITFAGEQHGFRRSDSIARALDAELYFYSRVFGFDLAEPIEPVPIENLDEARTPSPPTIG
ncbi:MAG TPA: S9 family peptidase [Chloroflexota bacterium]|nr:S9 family peptidase [Chloroflexota bacterium]